MRVSQQVSVALAFGTAANAWVLPFPLPSINLPNLPTPTIPGFTIPGFTIPGLPQQTTTKKTTAVGTTTTSSKAVTTSSVVKSSSTFGSSLGSSIVSGSSKASVVGSSSSSSKGGPTSAITTSTSKPAGSSSAPVVGSSSAVKPSGSSPAASSSSSAVKPSGSASSPAGSSKPSVAGTSTLATPYLPPGQTGTLQSPTCVNSTVSSTGSVRPSVVSSASKAGSSGAGSATRGSSGAVAPSGKPSGVASSSGKVSSSTKVPGSSAAASSSGKVSTSTQKPAGSASSSGKVSSVASTAKTSTLKTPGSTPIIKPTTSTKAAGSSASSSSGKATSGSAKTSGSAPVVSSKPSSSGKVAGSSVVSSSSKATASTLKTPGSTPIIKPTTSSKAAGSSASASSGKATSGSVKTSGSAPVVPSKPSSSGKVAGSSAISSSSKATASTLKTPGSTPIIKPTTSSKAAGSSGAASSSKAASGTAKTSGSAPVVSSKPTTSGKVSAGSSSSAAKSSPVVSSKGSSSSGAKSTLTTSSKAAVSSAKTSSSAAKSSASSSSKLATTASAISSKAASSTASKKPSSVASSIGSVKPSPTITPSTLVNTTSGQLQCGVAPNVTGVTQCLGIPFAQPPVGNLRFAAPVAYTSNRVINATQYGADCPATLENVPAALGPRLYGLLGSLGQVGDTLAEDCLFLNVWMKNNQTTTTKKPVLVWIYGGGFNFGGSAVDVYSGKYFAQDEDVVFVSLNYRVNILGFSGAPNQTQNVGLLDQRLAVEWVRDNIANFGGDPDRITLFGQSAGGASTDLYRYAWTSDPIVAGTIPMSGTANSFGSRTADQGATSWYNVTTTVGCGNSTTSTDSAILACMRNVSVDAIEKAAAPSAGLGSLLGNFGPVIDGKTVFANYTDLGVKGQFIQKPVLAGNLNYESGLFILIAAGAGQSYPQSFWDYVDEQVFTCPVSRTVEYAAAKVPTWRYYYSGMYPNELIPTANISQAWHTAELPVLFGTTEEIERNAGSTLAESANTAPQVALATYIRHAWVTFASNPTSGLASSEFGWPQYSASGNNVVFLGQNNMTVAYGPSTNITGPCSL